MARYNLDIGEWECSYTQIEKEEIERILLSVSADPRNHGTIVATQLDNGNVEISFCRHAVYPEDIAADIIAGKKISAIAKFRHFTGLRLKECKTAIEALQECHKAIYKQYYHKELID